MIIKSFETNKITSNKQSFFLLYGENQGLKNQITENIIKDFKENIIRYDEVDIINNPEIIFSELNNISLFENRKTLIINRVTDKFFSIIESLLDKNYEDIKIILNAGLLDKKSKMRNKFEKSKNLVCIPFYSDDTSTLANLANNFFKKYKVPISQENINIIAERCRGDRKNLVNELSKIESLVKKRNKITAEDIIKITNLAENYSYSELSDHCLNKNLKKINNILNENNYTYEDCIGIIRIMLFKVKRLIILKENQKTNTNIDSVISNYKPSIFWKDKELVKSQMKVWNLENIRKFMYILSEIELLIKKQNLSAMNILYDFIISQAKTNN
tara:strand:+ start:536 stop:1525 length:990 start_codon:yes stop_codon:yes gene_type:complete